MRLNVRPARKVTLRLAVVLQFLGLFLLIVALLVSLALGGRGTASLVISAVAAVSLVVGVLVLWAPPWILRLSEDDYRIRFVRSAGVRSARWADVSEVVTTTVANTRCLVLRLGGLGQTVIPVDVLDGDPDQLVRTIRDHLTEINRRPPA